MPHDTLDYRNPSTTSEPRPTLALGITLTFLLAASIAACAATWTTPRRFIFVPGGDAASGFRSHAGWLTWVEFTEWDNKDYPSWSLPWAAPITAEAVPLALLLARRARRRQHFDP